MSLIDFSLSRKSIGVILFLFFAIFLFSVVKTTSDAQSIDSWVSSSKPNFVIGDKQITSKYLMPGNRSCQTKTIQTLVFRKTSDKYPTETPVEQCIVRNGLGEFSNEYLSPGTFYFYKTHFQYSTHSIYATPNYPAFFYVKSNSSGYKTLRLYKDIRSNGDFGPIRSTTMYSAMMYVFNNPLKEPLRDGFGNDLLIGEFAFSQNGEWMVAEAAAIGYVRMHIPTGSMTLFSTETISKPQGGLKQSKTFAISNDGRHVIKSGLRFGKTKIYDLSGCPSNYLFSASNRNISGCQEIVIDDYLKSEVSHISTSPTIYLDSMRFSESTRTIRGLVFMGDGGIEARREIIISLDTINQPTGTSYLALGDSFASGEGDNNDSWYEEGTNQKDINLCHLSKRSYPYLIANDLQIPKFYNVACSGAKLQHILNNAQYPLTDTSLGLKEWSPGSMYQTKFLDEFSSISFITLSIGGNDAGFGPVLAECAWRGSCDYASSPTKRGEVAVRLADMQRGLKSLYEEIASRTNRQTRIYVVGYPQFIKSDYISCGLNVRLDNSETQFITKSVSYANQVIKSAAEAAGVYYIDAEKALENQNLCSDIPDSQMAVNGVTEGDDRFVITYKKLVAGAVYVSGKVGIGNESFHPNHIGQNLLKQSILAATNNSPANHQTCSSPDEVVCPNPTVKIPYPDENYFGNDAWSIVDLLNNPSAYPAIITSEPRNFINEVLSEPRTIDVKSDVFASNSVVEASIHSEPLSLGSFQANDQGLLDIELEIPESVPPGFHEVHLLGKNIAGEQVDYYQNVFIAGPESDINFNNIHDSQDLCGFVEAAGVDFDEDNIDDACDPVIGQPPEELPDEEGEELPSDEETGPISEVTPGPQLEITPEPEEVPLPVFEPSPEPGPSENNTEETTDEEPGPGTISGVNPSINQAPQGSQNLQQNAVQPQNTGSDVQTVSGVQNGSNSNVTGLLNQGLVSSEPLSVGVASTSTESPAPAATEPPRANADGLSSLWVIFLVVLIVGLLALAYKKIKDASGYSEELTEEPEDLSVSLQAAPAQNKPKKKKKKSKNPRRR